jgi:hypothetical protein
MSAAPPPDDPGMTTVSGVRVLVVAAVLMGASGCGLLSFDVSQDIPAQTVPGSPLGALLPVSLFAIPMNVDIRSETAAHGTGPADSVTLSSISLTVMSPSDATFDFVDSIVITIATADGSLPEIEIARLQPVPGTTSISIPPEGGVDLLPYINAGATISAAASGHMPASDTTFAGVVVVTVHV